MKTLLSIYISLITTFISINAAYGVTDAEIAMLDTDVGKEFENGSFIVPNEADYFRFSTVNAGKSGTIISVGTFRTLAAASMGNFEQIIFADLDQRVNKFNAKQISVLAYVSNFNEFVAALMEKSEIINDVSAITNIQQIEAFKIKWMSRIDINESETLDYVVQLLRFRVTDNGRTFLTNQLIFDRLRSLATNGKMHVLAADLFGCCTIKNLGFFLRKHHEYVSVIDTSNVTDYLWGHLSIIDFYENLLALPLSANSIFNYTSSNTDILHTSQDTWAYGSIKSSSLTSAIQSPTKRNVKRDVFLKSAGVEIMDLVEGKLRCDDKKIQFSKNSAPQS